MAAMRRYVLTVCLLCLVACGEWEIQRLSEWSGYRWAFQGGGSIGSEVHVGAVRPAGQGQLSMTYAYPRGRGTWMLDEATLRSQPVRAVTGGTGKSEIAPAEPPASGPPNDPPSPMAGLQLRTAQDLGSSGQPGISFVCGGTRLAPTAIGPATARRLLPRSCRSKSPPSSNRVYCGSTHVGQTTLLFVRPDGASAISAFSAFPSYLPLPTRELPTGDESARRKAGQFPEIILGEQVASRLVCLW